MKAVNKYILVDDINEEVVTKSGLLLTGEETSQIRYGKGRVLSPGTEVETVVEGDEVYFDKARSHKVAIDGYWVRVILERDIVVKLEKS